MKNLAKIERKTLTHIPQAAKDKQNIQLKF